MQYVTMMKTSLKGVLIAVIFMVTGTLVLSTFVNKEKIDLNDIRYAVMAVTIISSSAGAWIATKIGKERKLILATLSGLILFGILFAVGGSFFDSAYKGVLETLLLIMGTSIGITLLTTGRRKRKRYSKRKN